MRTLCRRSLYVNKNISKGEVLRKEDLAFSDLEMEFGVMRLKQF